MMVNYYINLSYFGENMGVKFLNLLFDFMVMYAVKLNLECPGENLVKILDETAQKFSHYVEVKPLRDTPPREAVIYLPNMCLWSRRLEFGDIPYEEVDSKVTSVRISKVRPTRNTVTHFLFSDFFWKWTVEAIIDERKSYRSLDFTVYKNSGIVEEVGKWDVRKYRRKPLRNPGELLGLGLLLDEFERGLNGD